MSLQIYYKSAYHVDKSFKYILNDINIKNTFCIQKQAVKHVLFQRTIFYIVLVSNYFTSNSEEIISLSTCFKLFNKTHVILLAIVIQKIINVFNCPIIRQCLDL